MDHVLPRRQERSEVFDEFVRVDLGGAGFRPCGHGGVELVKGHALPQVIRHLTAVDGVVEANVMDIPGFEVFLGKVCGGAAAQYIIAHGWLTSFNV